MKLMAGWEQVVLRTSCLQVLLSNHPKSWMFRVVLGEMWTGYNEWNVVVYITTGNILCRTSRAFIPEAEKNMWGRHMEQNNKKPNKQNMMNYETRHLKWTWEEILSLSGGMRDILWAFRNNNSEMWKTKEGMKTCKHTRGGGPLDRAVVLFDGWKKFFEI